MPVSGGWDARFSGNLPYDVHDLKFRHVRDPHQSLDRLPEQPLKPYPRPFLGPEIGGNTSGDIASLRLAKPLNHFLDT